jgi:hypothetical protein
MAYLGKVASLIAIVVLAVSGLLVVVAPARAAVPVPSVPEFTVKLVAYPYDVAPTTTSRIDSYTGKEIVTTTGGYHVENKSIEITIKNQPLAAYSDAEGHTINIYYNVRVKGHFAQDWEWKELFSPYEISSREGFCWALKQSPIQSSAKSTVLSCSADYPDGSQVDFQVQALQGYFTKYYPIIADAYGWYFNGQVSSWSSTQIINLAAGVSIATTPTPPPFQSSPTSTVTGLPSESPTATQSQQDIQSGVVFGLSWEKLALVASVVVIAVLATALVFALRRRT